MTSGCTCLGHTNNESTSTLSAVTLVSSSSKANAVSMMGDNEEKASALLRVKIEESSIACLRTPCAVDCSNNCRTFFTLLLCMFHRLCKYVKSIAQC